MADIRDKAKAGIDNAADKAKQVTDRVADSAQGTHGSFGGQGVQGTVNHLKDQAQGVVDKARDVAGQAADAVSGFANQARDRVQSFAGDAADRFGTSRDQVEHFAADAYDSAGERLGDFGKEVSTMIRRYPIPALLVGFGVGLLLGRAAKA